MGHVSGFLNFERKKGKYAPVDERIRHYKEFTRQLPPQEIQIQGARCMECGIPFCHALGCPLGNLIPEWNDYVYKGQWKEALDRLQLTSNFPEITGRICPATCEASCTLSINSSPVSIKEIELAIVENGFSKGWIEPQPPGKESGKRVAVIGSGPAGLSAAQQLRRAGHKAVVFEKADKPGGILRYGIPDFKLEKWVLDRRLEQLGAEGVEFQTDVVIGEDISARYLKKSFDVILLAMGSGMPRDLNVTGRGRDGVHFAMDYLTQSNQYVAGELNNDQIISARDKTVLVIGGGDTGSDCVGTANRQGANKVYQFEILPQPEKWENPWNPRWPDWPQILRTTSSHEEGCERRWGINTQGFFGRSTRVEEGAFVQVEWEKNSKGKWIMKEIDGSEFSLKLDLVLLAMGFVQVEQSRLLEELGVELDQRQNIKTDARHATSAPGVFAAGDAVTGASLVVRAMNQGRAAAHAIDSFLKAQ